LLLFFLDKCCYFRYLMVNQGKYRLKDLQCTFSSLRRQSPFIDQIWDNHIFLENRLNCNCFVLRIRSEFFHFRRSDQTTLDRIQEGWSDYYLKIARLEWVASIISHFFLQLLSWERSHVVTFSVHFADCHKNKTWKFE